MAERWYTIRQLPDLTLNKYSSLEENGVDGVIKKHISFLRQLNRAGIVSGLSYHLFYLYLKPEDKEKDTPGRRLNIFLLIRGNEDSMRNVQAMIESSSLSAFFRFEEFEAETDSNDKKIPASLDTFFQRKGIPQPEFSVCSFLTKTETLLPAGSGEGDDYYMLREWEMNDDGRLYDMCRMMSSLDKTALYRVDLYPVERSGSLREALRKPMNILRKRQDDRSSGMKRDYDGKDVLDNYEDMIEKYESSPHFISNIMVFANNREDATSILDAAGSESLMKGKYSISTFTSRFSPLSFLYGEVESLDNLRDRAVMRKGRPGLIICQENTVGINLNYLPTLFSLEEIAPFFRFPALYDGETIQLPKETAPQFYGSKNALYLGKDRNGYDVNFPLSLLPKHAFISGVPGSGKTNTMHHITSSLWKNEEARIPFLVLEPAKQEYRALLNDPEMQGVYLFAPNADMSFPLHINPFEMPKGTLVAEHIRRMCSVFEGAFQLDNPMPFLLDTAIEAVYRELGWIPEHRYTGEEKDKDGVNKKRLPTMSMLYRRLEQELKSTKYSAEVSGNLESALKVRIGSLLRREMGDVFDVPESTFPPEKWLEVPAIIELESMGTGPANFLTLMLCSLIRETLKANPKTDKDVRHVIFIEEAHNLIGPESEKQPGVDADPKQAATEFIVKMLAEVRALKEGIVIADQLPSVMAQEVLKNTGLKLGLRITSADDRSLLGSTMAASQLQLEEMSTFPVGEALIFYESLMRPFNVHIQQWRIDINDKPEDTTPKSDEELCKALRDNANYLEENRTSVRIILKKYSRMFEEIKPKIAASEKWYYDYLNQLAERDAFGQYCEKIERGIRVVPDAEKEKLYDDYYECQVKLEELSEVADTKKSEAIGLMTTAKDWVYTLERLKTGRWKRFDIPEEDLVGIDALQTQIVDFAAELCLSVTKVTEESGALKSVKTEIEKLYKKYCLQKQKRLQRTK
ncbi:MAG: hypothetical protein LUG86_02895 [Oscillospiraceae bacterium]|nr:hypothetical protein [Oscillospiraceae bacterium]